MKIGILANEGSWYYRDLERAASILGHECVRLDFERLKVRVGKDGARTQIEVPSVPCVLSVPSFRSTASNETSSCDAIIVRTMPPGSLEQVVYRMDVLGRLETAGVRVVNSPKSLECAVDKFLTTSRLQAAGLPVPETIVCEHEDDALLAFQELGGDVVVKPLFGSEGRGIVRVSDPDLAHRTFRTLMRLNAVLYLQKFVEHEGFDVRIVVLAGRVMGGMRRRSPGDFRTNVARNAIAEPHDVTVVEAEFALRATQAVGAHVAGVDLLYDRLGTCHVIEVNAVPGWQAFSKVTGVDVAAQLLQTLSGK